MKKVSKYTPKPKSLTYIFGQLVVRNAGFYILLTVFMYYVHKTNATMQQYSDNIALFIFFLAVLFLVSCFMEMRLVTEEGRFMLPVLRFFAFLGKFAVVVINYLFLFLLSSYILCLMLNPVVCAVTLLIEKLRLNRYDKNDDYYIDYLLIKKSRTKAASPLAGIIISAVLLVLSIVWLVLLLVFNYNYGNMMATAVISILLMLFSIVFYSVSFFNLKKQGNKE